MSRRRSGRRWSVARHRGTWCCTAFVRAGSSGRGGRRWSWSGALPLRSCSRNTPRHGLAARGSKSDASGGARSSRRSATRCTRTSWHARRPSSQRCKAGMPRRLRNVRRSFASAAKLRASWRWPRQRRRSVWRGLRRRRPPTRHVARRRRRRRGARRRQRRSRMRRRRRRNPRQCRRG